MSQLKQKITTRSACRAAPIPESPSEHTPSDATPVKSKNLPAKKPLQKSLFAMGFKKEETEIQAEPVELTYTIKQLLRPLSISEIIQNCPKIRQLYELLASKPFVKDSLVLGCLDKYFHSNTTSLWSNKYSPKQFNELSQLDFAQKIEEWIKDFYYFRKQSSDSEFGFIDNDSDEMVSKSLQVRMKEHGWNCRALVLKGRSGVGKSSMLRAITNSMGIRCFEYASDVDQLQKMKELLDGASSDAVNNIQNKKKDMKNNKLIKQNSSITKFIPQTAAKECLETRQPKRMQVFKNFTHYFPPNDKADRQHPEDAFFKYLFESINDSSIPYVLTSSEMEFSFREKQLNQKFGKFDQIEFTECTVDDLVCFYWVVFQIESNLLLQTWHKIKKQELFPVLNAQLSKIEFIVLDNMHMFRQLVINANKKPLLIANCLQFLVLSQLRQSQDSMGPDTMMPAYDVNYFLEKVMPEVAQQVTADISSHDLVNNIDWSLYDRTQEELSSLDQTASDELEKQYLIDIKKADEEETTASRKPTLKQIRDQLELCIGQDRRVNYNEYFHFETSSPAPEQDEFLNIPIQTHIRAKRQIVRNIKNNLQDELRPDLTARNLHYLPLRIAAKRTTRTLRKFSRETVAESLAKLMNFRELQYMQKFGRFIFPA